MKIRLTRKLADRIDGVDLSTRKIGDVFDLPPFEAGLVIAEGWASAEDSRPVPSREPRAKASTAPVRREPRSADRRFADDHVVSRHAANDLKGRAPDRRPSDSRRDFDRS
jgi:hypothetical protein